jgi:hypothetical protein
MRDTKYATELKTASLSLANNEEARFERLYVKGTAEEEIRFSWWNEDRIIPRPLELSEEHLLQLFRIAIDKRIFADGFLSRLKSML